MANFPDLNDDGKVTRADILKGRGVFKRGGKVKKIRKFVGGDMVTGFEGEPESLAMKKAMARYAEKPKSDLDKLRSDLKSTGRAGMAGAKTAAESIPMFRGAKDLASRIGQKSMPKSYDEEMGMKKGGNVKKYNKGGMELYNEALQAGGRSGIAAAKESTLGKPSTPEKKEMIKKESTKLGTLDFPYSKKTSREFSEMKKGGKVSSASKRADGCAIRGKTRA